MKVDVIDYNGVLVAETEFLLSARKHIRVAMPLPTDTYGVAIVHGSDILVRNFVTKGTEYVLPFIGR